jgi:ATP-dependent protease ClpP protease subunit
VKEVMLQQERIIRVLRERTRKPLRVIRAQCRKDRHMTPEEALKFGLIDEIV